MYVCMARRCVAAAFSTYNDGVLRRAGEDTETPASQTLNDRCVEAASAFLKFVAVLA